jgi:hypothetical protein
MASVGKDDSRLDFPLPAELKETIELPFRRWRGRPKRLFKGGM